MRRSFLPCRPAVLTACAVLAWAPVGLAQTAEPVAAPTADAPAPPPGSLFIDGRQASIRLGILAQPSYEYLDRTITGDDAYQSFYLRRARFLALISLGTEWELFADTETANLGRSSAGHGGAAATVAIAMQDIFVSWTPAEAFKLDVGLFMAPLSHNGMQGASTLYGIDYYAFSAPQNQGLQNFNGRDTGAQVRGLIAGHLEYRLGLFSGRRGPAMAAPTGGLVRPSQAALRVAGRVQYNVFDPERGFFYAGTYGGNKRVLSLGVGADYQKDYQAVAADLFLDWPIGADVITVQADLVRSNGDGWAPVPKQTDFMAEVGYRIGALKLSPIFRIEIASMARPTPANPDQRRFGGGLAWWYLGHNTNFKVFYTRVRPHTGLEGGTHSHHQLNAQVQFYVF